MITITFSANTKSGEFLTYKEFIISEVDGTIILTDNSTNKVYVDVECASIEEAKEKVERRLAKAHATNIVWTTERSI